MKNIKKIKTIFVQKPKRKEKFDEDEVFMNQFLRNEVWNMAKCATSHFILSILNYLQIIIN